MTCISSNRLCTYRGLVAYGGLKLSVLVCLWSLTENEPPLPLRWHLLLSCQHGKAQFQIWRSIFSPIFIKVEKRKQKPWCLNVSPFMSRRIVLKDWQKVKVRLHDFPIVTRTSQENGRHKQQVREERKGLSGLSSRRYEWHSMAYQYSSLTTPFHEGQDGIASITQLHGNGIFPNLTSKLSPL